MSMKKIRLCLACWLPVLLVCFGVKSEAQEQSVKDRTAVQKQEQVLLALHQQHRKAADMTAQGRLPEAEAELRQIVSTCRQVFGKEHPDTLISRSNLAATLAEEGKYAEAEKENRAVLAIRQDVLGAEHPDTRC
jgi:hypothetical protein